jgi:hypothetical protein
MRATPENIQFIATDHDQPKGINLGTDGKAEILMKDPSAELLNRPTNVALRDNKIYYANLGGWYVGAFDFDAGPMPLRYPNLR